MVLALQLFSAFLILVSLLPFISNPHWIFRVAEFLKLQLIPLQIGVLIVSSFYLSDNPELWYFQIIQFGLLIYHIYLLIRFTKFWRVTKFDKTEKASEIVKVISCNIYQFNKEFDKFNDLIRREQPDVFLTMESDSRWEGAMRVLEKDYPEHVKVTLENTYGMHFFTKLKVYKKQVHYFVSDDLPSIEVELETNDGHRFVFFGVHPPPPSPTEEETSKERDGDLLSVAKRIRDYKLPVVVTGDFNNVAWAKSSILFKKTSRLIDARIGRGVLSTFHTKYWFFRVPLDLLFHSADVFIDTLSTYPSIGSDHFPVGFTFYIDKHSEEQDEEVQNLDKGEMQEVNKRIEEGKEEESDNR